MLLKGQAKQGITETAAQNGDWFWELSFVLLLIQREGRSDEFASHRFRKQRGRPPSGAATGRSVGPEVTLNNVDSHKSKFGTGGDAAASAATLRSKLESERAF